MRPVEVANRAVRARRGANPPPEGEPRAARTHREERAIGGATVGIVQLEPPGPVDVTPLLEMRRADSAPAVHSAKSLAAGRLAVRAVLLLDAALPPEPPRRPRVVVRPEARSRCRVDAARSSPKIVAAFERNDPRFAEFRKPFGPSSSLQEAADFAESFIRASCYLPATHQIDSENAGYFGGHIHVATLAPPDPSLKSRILRYFGRGPWGKFQWVPEKGPLP